MSEQNNTVLECSNLFIDTECFVHAGFNLTSPALKKVRDFGSARRITVILTQIVIEEVRTKLAEQIHEAYTGLRTFRSKTAILINSADDVIRDLRAGTVTLNQLSQNALEQWDRFVSESNAIVLDTRTLDNRAIFKMYFASEPPFGSGKKKNEFPDAFSLLAVEHWAIENKQKVYVISGDSDHKNWCQGRELCLYLNSIEEFLDAYNTEEKLTQVVHNLIERKKECITDLLKNAFTDCLFCYDGNWEAEVEDVTVNSISIDNASVIEVDKDHAVVSLVVHIESDAQVSGPDYDSAIWDSEDKRYIFLHDFSGAIDFEDDYTVTLELVFNDSTDDIDEIKNIEFENSNTITVYCETS